MKNKALFMVYLATIPLANWFIGNVGYVRFPNAPHVLPVGFGFDAPSGVLFVGIALFTRDILQDQQGKKAVLSAISIGFILSALVNPQIALASAVAFGISELADFAIYTRLRIWSRSIAMFCSGLIGSIFDSFLFLFLAFNSIQFWQGQVVGKIGMTVICIALLKGTSAISKWMSAIKSSN
jgi:uncharacterized PurR-regulated membrane protein YhhQ (DUF165 family)